MAKIDNEYYKLCAKILDDGLEYIDERRDVTRIQIPSYTFRHSFKDGFPAITNKKLYWKGIVAELIWFLRGDNDIKFLNEHGVKIWNNDAYNWYIKGLKPDTYPLSFEEFEKKGVGSVGQNYSVQWRNFNGNTDQIANLIRDMEENIMGSRLKVNAWNPSETDQTALPPCHSEFQVIGVPLTIIQRLDIFVQQEGYNDQEAAELFPNHTDLDVKFKLDQLDIAEFGFELHWNQRSVDTFLGLPFNIASYALLAKILEKFTGFPALGIEGTLKCVHFYDNQIEAAIEMLQRDPDKHASCELSIFDPYADGLLKGLKEEMNLDPDLDTALDMLKVSDFKLKGYTSDESIKVKMLAPKKL